ncbi:D-alanine--D-alanine ligase family protein [Oerskovia turbata]
MTTHTDRRIAVIGGGANDEHAVSIASAAAVTRALRDLPGHTALPLTIDEDGRWRDETGAALPTDRAVKILTSCDVAFPLLHGVRGEDGSIAGFLDHCGVPVVGSPVRAGALSMDKHATKLIARSLGIATATGNLVGPDLDAAVSGLHAPFVVKPVDGGSSNGVVVARDVSGVPEAVRQARTFGETVLVEEYVSGREVDIAVFRDRHGELRLGASLEIGVAPGGVFGATEKYDGSARFTAPAPISAAEEAEIQAAATTMYEALGCAGVARFDYFLTATGVVLNEVNTTPGMTERSQVPLMYAATGLDYRALIAELVDAAWSARAGTARQQAAVPA